MKDAYTPQDGFVYLSEREFLEPCDDAPFHIGQSYESEPAKTLRCLQCGGIEFNVGQGSYFTGIRCVTCGWEACVHEG